jgi:colanic acid/amylovoran biosynthesis glycosyltransferase
LTIAFFVTTFPCLSETFISNQIISLQDNGHIVHVFSQEKTSDKKIHKVVEDADLFRNTFCLQHIPKYRLVKIVNLLYKLVRYFTIDKVIMVYNFSFKNKGRCSVYELTHFLDKPDYDAVHAHFGQNGNYVQQLRINGLFNNAKFVTTFHGYDMMFEPSFYKQLFDSDVAITVNSEFSKNQILNLNCPLHKVHVLPVGLNTNYFTREKTNSKIFNLLFIGRLIEIKGPDIFLEICKELVDRNKIFFKAIIVGDGVLKNQLEMKIDSLRLNSVIELVGSKTQEEIKGYMEKADVFILPGITHNGRSETQGLVIQEAQSMQIPTIISDAGGMAEGILDGITGFVVKQNSIEQFVEKVELLACENVVRKRMGFVAKKFVKEKYEIDKLTNQLLAIYECRMDK